MIVRHVKRALQDIAANRLVNAVTVVAVALAVLIVGAALLFFANTADLLELWRKSARLMAYLAPAPVRPPAALKQAIEAIEGVQDARFIPRDAALEDLKAQMRHQPSLFENLDENPLPDAFEIRLQPAADSWGKIESIAARIGALDGVEEVEYGRKWVDALGGIIRLFRATGAAMIGLFCAAAVAIVANTTRLAVHSRLDEMEIMRLVGADEAFIQTPFYIAAVLQGLTGAAAGLGVLFAVFRAFAARLESVGLTPGIPFRFLAPELLAALVLASMLVGWLGCCASLKHFLKTR
jgi:cell division transport system permease protein